MGDASPLQLVVFQTRQLSQKVRILRDVNPILQESLLQSHADRLRAVVRPQLGENIADVKANRPRAEG